MKPLTAIAAGALAFMLVVPSGAVGGPPRDSAVGTGTTGSKSSPTGEQHVAFAAFGGPTTFSPLSGFGGDAVTGHFRAGGDFGSSLTEFQQEGPVTCLVVDGNRARLVYPNKQARPETNEAFDVLIFLEDNGPSGKGGPPDRIGFVLLPDETPNDDPPSEQDSECVAPTQFPVMVPLSKGDFRIHDAG
jgi:hypothetical protein